tara:strand:- start:447 stop:710 length:264 start_codon:yes stop_codon:yes gene_type:complete
MNKKKPQPFGSGFYMNKSWRCPTLTWGDPTLPSALSVFTSEFEMESGGSHSLLPPEKLVWENDIYNLKKFFEIFIIPIEIKIIVFFT